jgi:predicted secreted hydrolase
MRSRGRRWFLGLLAAPPAAAEFALARPGYRYSFPRDHFNHPDFQTEWWYYTGNLFTAKQRRFGFELTFFRQAIESERARPDSGIWHTSDLWLAHFALSDLAGKRFQHWQRLHRSGPGLAGASAERGRIWNGNWFAGLSALAAVAEGCSLDLSLRSKKAPVIHGRDGISRKAAGEGRASHYISLTRIDAQGALVWNGERFDLRGEVWMDHEFFTHQLTAEQAGWDWYSIQLANGCELMLARIRRRDGSTDPFSHGTWVEPSGQPRHLDRADFEVTPHETWKSPDTGAVYPIRWTVRVAPLDLALEASTPLESQELESRTPQSPSYWEGAMDYVGSLRGSPIRGVGYLEMTGYDRAVSFD